MAGIRISELPATAVLLDTDQLLLSRNDSARRIAGSEFQTKVQTAQLSSAIISLSGEVFEAINELSTTTTTTISGLSAELYNKKRWVDFTS